MKSFTDKYYEKFFDLSLFDIMPSLDFKFKDGKVCFKGGFKFEARDITLFKVSSDKLFLPYIFSDGMENGKVLNLAPFLCVAVAELLIFCARDGGTTLCDYDTFLMQLDVFRDFKHATDVLERVQGVSYMEENDIGLNCAYSMRMDYLTTAITVKKRVSTILYLVYISDPVLFAELLFDMLRFCIPFISKFIFKKEKERGKRIRDEDDTDSFRDKLIDILLNFIKIDKEEYDFEKISYRTPSGKMRDITNARGISILLFCLLFVNTYGRLGVLRGKEGDDLYAYRENSEILSKFISDCIGSDITGDYLSGRGWRVKYTDKHRIGVRTNGYVMYRPSLMFNTADSCVQVELFEESFLFCHAHKCSFNEDMLSERSEYGVNMHYFTPPELVSLLSMYILRSDGVLKDLNKDNDYFGELKGLREENDKLFKQLSEVTRGKTRERYELEEKDRELNILRREASRLNALLQEKQDTIKRVLEENNALSEQLNRCYVEDDFLDGECSTTDISLEEMVCFLNDFRILCIGGEYKLLEMLRGIGCESFMQVVSVSELSGMRKQTDIIVVCTKFCSHHLTYRVKEKYSNQLDTMIYYNGTNINGLVHACYEFINTYLCA